MSQQQLDKYFDEFLALEPAPDFKELTDVLRSIKPLPTGAMDLWKARLDELLEKDNNPKDLSCILSDAFMFGRYKQKEIAQRLIEMDIEDYVINMILFRYPEYEEQLLLKYKNPKNKYLYLMQKVVKDIE